jgi:hypothetical protein
MRRLYTTIFTALVFVALTAQPVLATTQYAGT